MKAKNEKAKNYKMILRRVVYEYLKDLTLLNVKEATTAKRTYIFSKIL